MATKNGQRTIWGLIRAQHGVVTRMQLLAFGVTDQGIRHRLGCGRLRRVYPGVYAVGQLPLTQEGKWMAAILACGDGTALSHASAAALWRIAKGPAEPVHVSILSRSRSRKGVVVHRRSALHTTKRDGIRVTTPAQTLIDIATSPDIEQAIGEAVLRRMISLKALRTAATRAGRSGAPLRRVIERSTFRVTQSELERAFLRLVADAGLPLPESQQRFGESRVDFFWPSIGLIVETDGARFHASALQQTRDRRRDQQRLREGLTPMRVTHWQVVHEQAETTALLVDVFTACRCRRGSASSKRAA